MGLGAGVGRGAGVGVDDEEVVMLLPPPPPHAARVKIAANTAPILMEDFVMMIPFKWFFRYV